MRERENSRGGGGGGKVPGGSARVDRSMDGWMDGWIRTLQRVMAELAPD